MSETNKLNRSDQARINGAKSHGPITPEGKAISSSNALKHGFAAAINVVLTIEDKSAFDDHLEGLRASYKPTDYAELVFVEQLASISWRQARLVALESAFIEAQMSLHDEKVCALHPDCATDNYFHLVQSWRALASPPRPRTEEAINDTTAPPEGYDIRSMELLCRYQTSLDRQHRNTLLNFNQYRKNFASAPVTAPTQMEPKEQVPPNETTVQPDTPKTRIIVIHPPSTTQTVNEPAPNACVNPVTPINRR